MRRLRWQCEGSGCWVENCQARLGLFDECFQPEKPAAFGFSDVDGIVEHGGRFLFLEWKRSGGISGGQQRTLEALAKRGDTVLIVSGPTSGEVVRGWLWKADGERVQLEGLAQIRAAVRAWFEGTLTGDRRRTDPVLLGARVQSPSGRDHAAQQDDVGSMVQKEVGRDA